MRIVWAVAVILVVACGCELGTRTPAREQVRPYDLAPQSGYLAEGPTVSPDYAVPAATEGAEPTYDEAAYRAAIQKDLLRINELMTDNDRLRQELAAATSALDEANGQIERLRETVAALEEKLERAEARAARHKQ
jgi:hypothetical protein